MDIVHHQPNFDFRAPQPIPGSTEQDIIKMQCQIWEFGEPKKDQPCTFYVTPFRLLNNYANASNSNKAREGNVNYGRTLLTEEIMRVAGERFVQFSAQRIGNLSTSIMHPKGFSLFGEQTKDMELAQLLLSAAEKVSERQFDQNNMKETGKMLGIFAESLNLPFSFKVVPLSDMKELREEHFDVQAFESVAIFCKTVLRTVINKPDCLENLMGIIRMLNPSIMVFSEVESNHNSPSFFNRFVGALFFYSALFDCLEDCSERDDKFRMILEGRCFCEGIHNTIAAEGKERFVRNVNMSAWRAFFARFGMVEIELSETSMHQASLIAKQFACGSSFALYKMMARA